MKNSFDTQRKRNVSNKQKWNSYYFYLFLDENSKIKWYICVNACVRLIKAHKSGSSAHTIYTKATKITKSVVLVQIVQMYERLSCAFIRYTCYTLYHLIRWYHIVRTTYIIWRKEWNIELINLKISVHAFYAITVKLWKRFFVTHFVSIYSISYRFHSFDFHFYIQFMLYFLIIIIRIIIKHSVPHFQFSFVAVPRLKYTHSYECVKCECFK